MFASDLKHGNPSLQQKLHHLYSLNTGRKIELSFRAPFLELLQAFGNPHKKLPPVIHIAGTNGKGSIVATLRSILEVQGYKVHAYTSPHLCSFNERIYLAGHYISDELLESLIDEAIILNEGKDLTFFEITTSLAFAAFARTPADILLLETGLGGRLDCTNIVEHPIATIISAIGMDHMEFLGDTIDKIAAEKAGIFKQGVPCIVSHQTGHDVLPVLEQKASSLGAPMFRAGAEWVSDIKNGQMHFVFKPVAKTVERILPLPNLKGGHQIANAGAALAALEVIAARFPVSDEARLRGLQSIQWPGRLQDISGKFLGNWEIWLDGGHNENAAAVLSAQAKSWQAQDGKDMHLIVGMMAHKDPPTFIAPLHPWLSSLSFVNVADEPKSLKAADLKEACNIRDIPVQAFDDFTNAVQSITHNNKPGRILIAGSLYLAGHVLKTIGLPPHNDAQDKLTHAG